MIPGLTWHGSLFQDSFHRQNTEPFNEFLLHIDHTLILPAKHLVYIMIRPVLSDKCCLRGGLPELPEHAVGGPDIHLAKLNRTALACWILMRPGS